MQIESSMIVWDLPQVDGRRVVREEHVDDAGNIYDFDYMADANTDVQAKLAARAEELNAQLSGS